MRLEIFSIIRALLENVREKRVFFDDILVFSKTFEQHKESLKKVLNILREHNVSINIEKRKFFEEEVSYQGIK